MHMEPQTLTIENRTSTGKGEARRLRARGLVPGVFYGPGAEPVRIAATPKALTVALSQPNRRNTLLKLDVNGVPHLAMIKEVQVHPLTRQILHFDVYKVELDRKVVVPVPFAVEGRAKGVIAGGEVTVVFRDLPVRTTPDNIPPIIKVDVTHMELGDTFRVKNLQLPEGVEVTLEPERNLISCAEPRKRPEEEEAAAAAAAPGAEGAAPAAPGAPGTPAAAS
jgi:large subunit ribosomal protein L25